MFVQFNEHTIVFGRLVNWILRSLHKVYLFGFEIYLRHLYIDSNQKKILSHLYGKTIILHLIRMFLAEFGFQNMNIHRNIWQNFPVVLSSKWTGDKWKAVNKYCVSNIFISNLLSNGSIMWHAIAWKPIIYYVYNWANCLDCGHKTFRCFFLWVFPSITRNVTQKIQISKM